MKTSRLGWLIAAGFPLAVLVDYYAFVLHLHHALGGWPQVSGDRELTPGLLLHLRVTASLCLLLLGSTSGALGAAVTCGLVARWRRLLPYCGCCFVCCLLAIGLTPLAPAGFLGWWWD